MKYGVKPKLPNKQGLAAKTLPQRFLTEREAERFAEFVLKLEKGEYEVLGTQKPPTTLQHKMVSFWEKGKLADGDPAQFITRRISK